VLIVQFDAKHGASQDAGNAAFNFDGVFFHEDRTLSGREQGLNGTICRQFVQKMGTGMRKRAKTGRLQPSPVKEE
jgi:hypothetical protein